MGDIRSHSDRERPRLRDRSKSSAVLEIRRDDVSPRSRVGWANSCEARLGGCTDLGVNGRGRLPPRTVSARNRGRSEAR